MLIRVVLILVATAVASANEIVCPDEGQFFYPHPTLCSLFIECSNGVQTVQQCFGDFHFNPATGFCDFPGNVECENVVETEPPTLPPTEPPTGQPPTGQPPTTGPVGECPAVNGQYVDFLTDAQSCSIFYMCNWGTPIQMYCPNGLHFNPILSVCDWSQNAGCTVVK